MADVAWCCIFYVWECYCAHWLLGCFSLVLFPTASLNDWGEGEAGVPLEYILDVLWLIFAFGVLWLIRSELASFWGGGCSFKGASGLRVLDCDGPSLDNGGTKLSSRRTKSV